MARPSKKEIKASLDKLKAPAEGTADAPPPASNIHLEPKKTSQRIRKKGV